MPGKRHSESEIAAILKDWTSGMTVAQVSKKHKVTIQTLYRWKRQGALRSQTSSKMFASVSPKPQTLDELRAENVRLKAIIADLLMEKYNAA